ncbi:methytransferase partner Trm112 [Chloroflexota bacterium]
MKRALLSILACPVCKGELKLKVDEESEQEIVTGTLYCPECHVLYPIVDNIPNLLPPGQRN